MPASNMARRTSDGSASRLTPSACKMSAAPESEEKLRLPCLAMGTPAPATTMAAAVETLKLPWPSPPVPTISIAPSGGSTRSILARMVRAAPVISSTVSPRSRSADRKAPICAGVAAPDIMASKAEAASISPSFSPAMTRPNSALKVAACVIPPSLMAALSCRHARCGGEHQEILQQVVAAGRGDAFGMELHAIDRTLAVGQAHDEAVLGLGGHAQRFGQVLALDDQRMVARRRKRIGQVLEYARAAMADLGNFSVHRRFGAHHLAAESLADRLVAETDAEDGHMPGLGYQLQADAGMVGIARSGRDDDALRLQRQGRFDGERVVPFDRYLGAELAQVVPQVIGEAVVVIDQQEHKKASRKARLYQAGAGRKRLGRGGDCGARLRNRLSFGPRPDGRGERGMAVKSQGRRRAWRWLWYALAVVLAGVIAGIYF